MSHYTEITIKDMQSCLRAEKGWKLAERFSEYVFEFAVPSCPGLKIKVFTSINKHTLIGRPVGQDTIRVAAVYSDGTNSIGVVKSARVLRVEGWRNNLKKRVITVIGEAKERYVWAQQKLQHKICI